jgi:superfamily I DNA/RNA helicase
MPTVVAVMGPAGTGKTTRLLDVAQEYAERLITRQPQRLLAMTFMNGARRRLDSALQKAVPKIPKTTVTLDKFAATIVNRWRQADNLTFPISSSDEGDQEAPAIRHFRTCLSFDDAIARASRLIEQKSVGAWIQNSFPLILIDEFQDCVDVRLKFVQDLALVTQVIVAADAFQLLDSDNPEACPAVEWIESLENADDAIVERLDTTHRTNSRPLLDAAHALRNNSSASDRTVRVVCAPAYGLLAAQCMSFMLQSRSKDKTRPTWAFLAPSLKEATISKLLASLNKQLEARHCRAIRWTTQHSGDHERKELLKGIGLKSDRRDDDQRWTPGISSDPLANQVRRSVARFARLRGIDEITRGLARQFADAAVHGRAAHGHSSSRFLITTIHGAKNREFDNVVIFWGFKVPGDKTAQRKLLYNAVTRAKRAAILLVHDPESCAQDDLVLSLLGKPEMLGGSKKGTSTEKMD